VTAFQRSDDRELGSVIRSAGERLFFMAPGVSGELARALAESWRRLGSDRVQVVLDVDPEVCRLGYGSLEGLKHLEQVAGEVGGLVSHQAGVRIGVLIADSGSVVWSPVPLLVAADTAEAEAVNAVWLDRVPTGVENEAGLGGAGAGAQTVGLDRVPAERVEEVEEDLKKDPPQRFDLARVVRVFNAQFEFVEFELRGAAISRHTVPLPPDLMGLGDETTQRLLRSSFRLIDRNGGFGEGSLVDLKKDIVRRFLVPLKGYGLVVRRSNKAALIDAVSGLRLSVEDFRKRVHTELQEEMARNRDSLTRALLPTVRERTPHRWFAQLGGSPTDQELESMLGRDLEKAFARAGNLFVNMSVSLTFKAVTHESLTDPTFVAAAKEVLPGLPNLHVEYDAARGTPRSVQP
jgi:hypothetical protein